MSCFKIFVNKEGKTMTDTIYISGKLKRDILISELYEKISKSIKKKGPTKLWECHMTEFGDTIIIDFNDEGSETFGLTFNEKKEFDEFCKVDFPLEGEQFEDGKSEFKALIDILYKCRKMFSRFKISDDYGIASAYWECKRIKIQLRELTDEEIIRLMRLYSDGNNTHESLLLAVMAEDMGMTVDEFKKYRNYELRVEDYYSPQIYRTLETYLYETSEYKNDGRLYEIPKYIYEDLSGVLFAVCAFKDGLCWVFYDGSGWSTEIPSKMNRFFSPKEAQVWVFFRERFVPLYLQEEDNFEKCVLMYRYFVSVYDYLGFRFVGRDKNACKTHAETVLEEYGEEKGKLFLTFRCTCMKYFQGKNDDSPERQEIIEKVNKYLNNNWNQELYDEYIVYKRKYTSHSVIREIENRAFHETEYIDDSIVSN